MAWTLRVNIENMRRISSTNKHPRTIGLYTSVSHWSTVLSTDSFFHCHRLSSWEYALWNKKTAVAVAEAKDSGRKPCLGGGLIISCMSLVITERLRMAVAKMTSFWHLGIVGYPWSTTLFCTPKSHYVITGALNISYPSPRSVMEKTDRQ